MIGRSPSSRSSRYETERKQKSQRARSHYARVQQRKATRGQRRAILALTFVLAFGAGFAAGNGNAETWLSKFEAPAQTIERISVLGSKVIDPLEIAKRSGIGRGAALDGIDLAEATSRIASHPWLRAARLRRLPGGDILAIVDERSAIAVLYNEAGDNWQAVDRDGTAFSEIDPAKHPDLPRLRSEDATPTNDDVSTALELAQRLSASGVVRTAAIVLPTRSSSDTERLALGWRLLLADSGPEVVLGEDPSSERLARLVELLEAQLDAVRSAERIDLRFRDRAILRAAGDPIAEEANAHTINDTRAPESARATSSGERPSSV